MTEQEQTIERREELFRAVIVQLDSTAGEATVTGPQHVADFIRDVLQPFIEEQIEKERSEHAELEERIAQLTTGGFGASRREAELMLRDDDLWLIHDESRSAFEGEEAVRQWEEAHRIATHLVHFAIDASSNSALLQLAYDAQGRSKEALRRARERVRQGER
jgi:hypothetical protein